MDAIVLFFFVVGVATTGHLIKIGVKKLYQLIWSDKSPNELRCDRGKNNPHHILD